MYMSITSISLSLSIYIYIYILDYEGSRPAEASREEYVLAAEDMDMNRLSMERVQRQEPPGKTNVPKPIKLPFSKTDFH